ncbi:MAG: phage holin family protein [Defluviitaleaceae bacterium]|nr:phage holin family protein [Defluviitaleaceae bacterium]MCL2263761.1 phage holin family protein [Defluviitaleaceae bacterium]
MYYFFARFCAVTAAGLAASILGIAFGGFDMLLQTLLLLMAVDMISGIISAVVFRCSTKTESGRLSSRAGIQGFFKKGCCLMLIIVAVHLDALIGTGTLTRDAAIIAFCVNELISIMENMGNMGIKMPAPIMNALDVLATRK